MSDVNVSGNETGLAPSAAPRRVSRPRRPRRPRGAAGDRSSPSWRSSPSPSRWARPSSSRSSPVRARPAACRPGTSSTRGGARTSPSASGDAREAVGGNGWGLDYLDAIKTQYRYGEDGIAGLTTRDGAFAIGWAAWDGRQVRVAERYFGWSNPSGEHGEAIVDQRTFGPNTPTSSYYRTVDTKSSLWLLAR